MKRYEGFAPQRSSRREQLPPGGYVAKIMGVEEPEYKWGSVLVISFDIAEGQYKGFFTTDYRQNTRADKTWRGNYRLTCPRGDGSEKDGWNVNAMNNFAAVLQESNPGYTWDWEPLERGDYSQLKGKILGVLFGNKEWEYNGKTGWNSTCRALIPAEDVRQGNFETPEDKPLAQKVQSQSGTKGPEDYFDADDDLPF